MNLKQTLFACSFFIGSLASGQAVDNTTIFRTVQSDKYIRFHYENDFFTATDKYYTQGLNLEFVHPILRYLPINRLLVKPKNAQLKYGLAFEHNGYTPTSIRHLEIILNDRPFAACLYAKFYVLANDSIKNQRLMSSISIGIIGSAAGAKEMQEGIHRWLKNIQPLGWNHQIKNDVIVNYEVNFDKSLYSYKNMFLLSYNVGARAGTLSDKAYGGFMFMFGNFDSPFRVFALPKKKYQVYLYAQPQVNFVGYDATLQGGLFNRDSPYTISASNIKRLTSATSFGVVFKLKKLQLEYFRTYLSKEFKTGNEHFWGGVRIAVRF